MDTKKHRVDSFQPSIPRSRSPISDNGISEVSISSEEASPNPIKSSAKRNHNHDEQNANTNADAIGDDTASSIMSDNDEMRNRKRSEHRHRPHKQSKTKKRSMSHQQHSAKRSRKDTVLTKRRNKKDHENSVNSSEKNTSESDQSQIEETKSPSLHASNDEEGIIEDDSTPSEHRSRRRRNKRQSPSPINERDRSNSQSSQLSIPKNNKGTQLIVNYLPASLTESEFYQLFVRIAPIKLCKLITDRYTGHSYCYGFIEYQTNEDAVKAIEKYNGYQIEHKKLKVSYAKPKSSADTEINNIRKRENALQLQKNPNIYITDLPDSYDEKKLERLFSKYGKIVQIKVLRDPRTKISRGIAFVLMSSTRYAERAVKALNGYVPSSSGTPISVKYADPKKTTTSSTNNDHDNSLFHTSKTSLLARIGPYGYPPDSPGHLMDQYYVATYHKSRYNSISSRAFSPSSPLSQSSYDGANKHSSRLKGSSPTPSRSHSSSKHNVNNSKKQLNYAPSTLAAACDLISKGLQQAIDPNGFVIYAFGLPHDCEENDLETLFRRYGDVYRVYIVRNYTTGESKGYSFITMRNYEEACRAVDGLDGSIFQGRTIQVRFKQ